jgi:hypothetical protein
MILLVSQSSKTLRLMPQLILKLNSFTNFMPTTHQDYLLFSTLTYNMGFTLDDHKFFLWMDMQFIDAFRRRRLFCSFLFVAICKTIPGITKLTRHFKVVGPSFPNTPLLTGANKWRCCLLAAHRSLTTTHACMHMCMHACVRVAGRELPLYPKLAPFTTVRSANPSSILWHYRKFAVATKNCFKKKSTANRISTVLCKSYGTGLIKLQPCEPVLKEPITVLTVSRYTAECLWLQTHMFLNGQ